MTTIEQLADISLADVMTLAEQYGHKNVEGTMIYIAAASDPKGLAVRIPSTRSRVKQILDAVHAEYLPSVVGTDDSIEWSKEQIEAAADFAFTGEPRAYMEFNMGDHDIRRLVYTVYGYVGDDPHLLVRGLTKDLCDAIKGLDGRHTVIWRRDPELREEFEGHWWFTMRLAVMDENWDQMALGIACVPEGSIPQERELGR